MIECGSLRVTDCVELRWLMHGLRQVTEATHNHPIGILRDLRVAKIRVLKYFRFNHQGEIIASLQ